MGSSVSINKTGQLDDKSLSKVKIQGIRVIDSGYVMLSSSRNSTKQYVLVLNRRNNYSIRERTITDTDSDPDWSLKEAFKNDANKATKAWKQLKQQFDA